MNLKKLTGIPLALAVAALLAIPTTATPAAVTVYDSIPSPLPPNYPSQPFQAQQTQEFGDHIQSAGSARKLDSVSIGMSAWAIRYQFPDLPDSGWKHPITLNIYNVDHSGAVPALGTLIATKTQLMDIPWRPDGDPTCPIAYPPDHPWRASDGNCYNGYAFEITFDMSSENVILPNEIIYGIAYNTQTWGYNPIGVLGPYDSLNVGTRVATYGPPQIGTDVEADAVFWNTKTAAWYADKGAGGVGTFRRDTGWTGYVPTARFKMLPASAAIAPTTATFCTGENTTLNINLADVVDLYGYQFKVDYDSTKVSASAAFVNSFFDTVHDASPVDGWKAQCAGGTCQFAVTKSRPAEAVNGSGTVASITFTGVAPGASSVTFKNGLLSDRDGNPTTLENATANLTVCGYASVSGKVTLQGRPNPGPELALPTVPDLDQGKVVLTDGAFGPYTADIDQTSGAFTISNIKVLPTGSTYTFAASHWLYLNNTKTAILSPGTALTNQNTKLLGGDANHSAVIDLGDLTCIGGKFNLPAAACDVGLTNWPDINNDGFVNIQDLSIAGGNWDLPSPQAW